MTTKIPHTPAGGEATRPTVRVIARGDRLLDAPAAKRGSRD